MFNLEYLVILYYKYIAIENLDLVYHEHVKICQNLNLFGRLIIAHEGINGTLSGLKDNIQKYIDIMQSHKLFYDLDFKSCPHTEHVFPKLSIKIKKEIVNFDFSENLDLLQIKGDYLLPQEFYRELKNSDNVIIDARNDYEYRLGHFMNAINPEIKNFRDLPQWIEKNKDLIQNKKILTYCTGGVRCEKFSGFLKYKGFKEVYQLKGGIINYGKNIDIAEDLWAGKLYVFDKRIAININVQKHSVIGKDFFDGTPCDRYINCSNPQCNKQFFCSKNNEKKFYASCCHECLVDPKNKYVLHCDSNLKEKII